MHFERVWQKFGKFTSIVVVIVVVVFLLFVRLLFYCCNSRISPQEIRVLRVETRSIVRLRIGENFRDFEISRNLPNFVKSRQIELLICFEITVKKEKRIWKKRRENAFWEILTEIRKVWVNCCCCCHCCCFFVVCDIVALLL